jgi:hypothetical protein
MQPAEFIKTIYLGDRACQNLLIDGWNERVVIQVDCISRIRSASGHWDFYTDEDINEGLIVFTGVRSITFSPQGPIPNDLINSLEVLSLESESVSENSEQAYVFQLSVGSVDSQGHMAEVTITIVAGCIHLESPDERGVAITK